MDECLIKPPEYVYKVPGPTLTPFSGLTDIRGTLLNRNPLNKRARDFSLRLFASIEGPGLLSAEANAFSIERLMMGFYMDDDGSLIETTTLPTPPGDMLMIGQQLRSAGVDTPALRTMLPDPGLDLPQVRDYVENGIGRDFIQHCPATVRFYSYAPANIFPLLPETLRRRDAVWLGVLYEPDTFRTLFCLLPADGRTLLSAFSLESYPFPLPLRGLAVLRADIVNLIKLTIKCGLGNWAVGFALAAALSATPPNPFSLGAAIVALILWVLSILLELLDKAQAANPAKAGAVKALQQQIQTLQQDMEDLKQTIADLQQRQANGETITSQDVQDVKDGVARGVSETRRLLDDTRDQVGGPVFEDLEDLRDWFEKNVERVSTPLDLPPRND